MLRIPHKLQPFIFNIVSPVVGRLFIREDQLATRVVAETDNPTMTFVANINVLGGGVVLVDGDGLESIRGIVLLEKGFRHLEELGVFLIVATRGEGAFLFKQYFHLAERHATRELLVLLENVLASGVFGELGFL